MPRAPRRRRAKSSGVPTTAAGSDGRELVRGGRADPGERSEQRARQRDQLRRVRAWYRRETKSAACTVGPPSQRAASAAVRRSARATALPSSMSRDAQGSCTMAAVDRARLERSDQRPLAEALDGDLVHADARAGEQREQRQRAGRAGRDDADGLAGEIGERLDRVLLRRGHEERDGRRRGEAEDESRRRAARVAERQRGVERRGGERDAPAPERLRREGLRRERSRG